MDSINYRLEIAKFWALQTESNIAGNDGSEWIIEVFKNNRYHMVVRWSPDNGTDFRRIGEYLLSVSAIRNETNGYGYY